MRLASTPETMRCSECEEAVTDAGYLPAVESDGGYEPLPEFAVCDACGFNNVGMAGCAPTLDDVTDAERAELLLYVRRTDDGVDVLSAKE
ncbi:MAG: hypothetical protein ABEJ79_10435 [Halolamina sp.]